jgi:hypothetical protein
MKTLQRSDYLRRLNARLGRTFRDPRSRFVAPPFDEVAGLVGSCVFLRLSEKELVLVDVTSIALRRHRSGFAFLAALEGPVRWGSTRWKAVRFDLTRESPPLRASRIARFRSLRVGVPRSPWMFRFKRLRFRRLRCAGYTFAALWDGLGEDVVTREALILAAPVTLGLLCRGVLTFDCVNWACSGACQQTGTAPIIGSCKCPGTGLGFCAFTPIGTTCIQADCAGFCTNLTGWAAACLC